MADEAAADEAPVTFNIKSSSDAKYVVTVPLTMTVLDLKQKLSGAEYADIPPERQRLIYSGRVLKDPDALSTYKIKEGNTVHLVKGAASNQRQNPANSSTATASTGSTTGNAGVPTNIAAGTGNNPLAGLTGARYAGFAQLPGADMFGPDGGVGSPHAYPSIYNLNTPFQMGPPPDPERMADMLQNPQYASALNEALQNPAVIDQMIRDNPMLRNMGPQVRQAMQDPNMRRMMTDPDMLRQAAQMQRQFGGMFPGLGGTGGAGGGTTAFPAPGVTDTTPGQEGERTATNPPSTTPQTPFNPFAMFGPPGAGAGVAGVPANPFGALFQPPPATQTPTLPPTTGQESTPASDSNATNPQTNPIAAMAQQMTQNPAMMQQMLQAMGGGEGAGAAGAGAFNPFAMFGGLGGGSAGGSPAAPPDTRPPEERYEEQLRQLNDMGFYEFERNVEALRRTGGSVQGAVEYLLTH